MSLSSLNSIGQTIFEIESGNENVDRRTDGQTNGQTNRQNCTNFDRNLAMMVICVPVKFEFDWTNCFPSGNENVDGQMDGQKNGQKTDKLTDKQTDRITPISKGT